MVLLFEGVLLFSLKEMLICSSHGESSFNFKEREIILKREK